MTAMVYSAIFSDHVIDAVQAGMSAVKAFRVEAELTIGELAEDTGIPIERIEEIEAGGHAWAAEIEAIGGALHVPYDLLADE